eukprot:m.199691 g.199691  ORF g.199691 m.199691 type:complete len:255 (-) comp18395_c0_seq2:267-1031(-)
MATTGLPLLQELFGSDSETEREPGVECLGVAKRKRARRRSPRTSEHATTETICGTRPCRDGVCAYNAVLLPVDGVPGLQRCPLFLSPLQQSALLQQLDATYFEHAGPEKNQVMAMGKLPDWAEDLSRVMQARLPEMFPASIASRSPLFNQMIVNRYAVGQGIKAHVDIKHRFEDGIVVLSLGSTCVMEFRHEDEEGALPVDVLLRPGDLLCLHGDARWHWTHAIPERTTDLWLGQPLPRSVRTSVTLRKLKPID